MEIDLAAAARFLAALSPDTHYTFQTFDDAKRGRNGMTRVLHGTLAAQSRRLVALNDKGAGVFVMVNRGDGNGRRANNVTGCRALFLDLDGSPIEPVLAAPIPPRITVESSPGRWHAYWPVADLPPEQFTAAQKALAGMFAGDPKVHDKPRVMRLPGFLHRKGDPFLSRLVVCDDRPVAWQEMADAFGLAQRMTLPAAIPEGERNAMLFKLARSAAGKGVPEAEQLQKALTVNGQRCNPPLPELEVRQLVASAYNAAQNAQTVVPNAAIDSDAYAELDDSARSLLLLAYRRADKFNAFPLPWTECRRWFPRKDTFNNVRKRLVKSGLLQVAVAPKKAMPHRGRGPEPTFYRLAIGSFGVAYSNCRIGPFGVAPEAFQAVAVEAIEGEGPHNDDEELIGGDEKPTRSTRPGLTARATRSSCGGAAPAGVRRRAERNGVKPFGETKKRVK